MSENARRNNPRGRRRDAIARAAVDEVFGPEGAGPFEPTYRTIGGSTRPVIHSEEAAIDREQG
jgi:hypothetical protein